MRNTECVLGVFLSLVVGGAVLGTSEVNAESPTYADTAGLCNGLTPCFETVQEAVNAASDPDAADGGAFAEVFIFPGTFNENVDLSGINGGSNEGDISLVTVDAAGVPTPKTATIDGMVVAEAVSTLPAVYTGGRQAPELTFGGALTGNIRLVGIIARSDAVYTISVAAESDIVIDNVEANDNPVGVGISASALTGSVFVTDSEASRNFGGGFALSAVEAVSVSGSTANDNGGGFFFPLAGDGFFIAGALFDAEPTVTVASSTALRNLASGFRIGADFKGLSLVETVEVTGSEGSKNNFGGFDILARGDVTIKTSIANHNQNDVFDFRGFPGETADGYDIESFEGDILVEDSVANGNGPNSSADGFDLNAFEGGVTATRCTANDNRTDLGDDRNNDGFEIDARTTVVVTDCVANINTADGIDIAAVFQELTVGIDGLAPLDVTVSGCITNDNLDDGVDVSNAYGGDVTITDCVSVGNFDDDGFQVMNAKNVTMSNLTASLNGDEGIEIQNFQTFSVTNGNGGDIVAEKIDITRVTVEMNGIATTSGDGIDIDSGCGFDDLGMVIRLAAKEISITDSLIRMNMDDGIEFEGLQPTGDYKINGSIICENMVAGLKIHDADPVCDLEQPEPVIVDTKGNWWGDASGPTHPDNPGGIGDRIFDFVNPEFEGEFEPGTADYAPFIQQAQIDASPNPVQVGNNVAITVKFSDTGKSVFLGLGVGDANGEPPFTVFTDLGTLIGSQGSGASIKEFINQPAGVLATTLAATAAGEADVLVSGPCGLDASAKINVNAAPPGPQQPEPGPQPQPPASQPTDGQSTNGQADCGVGMCGFGSLGMMPFMMLGLAVMKRGRRRNVSVNKLMLFVFVGTLLTAVDVSRADSPVYVDPAGVCNGMTPCFQTIQEAVVAASDPDGPDTGAFAEVFIFPGNYDETVDLIQINDFSETGDIALVTVDAAGNPLSGTATVDATSDPNDGSDLPAICTGCSLEGGFALVPLTGNIRLVGMATKSESIGTIVVAAASNVEITDVVSNGNPNGLGVVAFATTGNAIATNSVANENLGGFWLGAVEKVTISSSTANDNGGCLPIGKGGCFPIGPGFFVTGAPSDIDPELITGLDPNLPAPDVEIADSVALRNLGSGVRLGLDFELLLLVGQVDVTNTLANKNGYGGFDIIARDNVTIQNSQANDNQFDPDAFPIPIITTGLGLFSLSFESDGVFAFSIDGDILIEDTDANGNGPGVEGLFEGASATGADGFFLATLDGTVTMNRCNANNNREDVGGDRQGDGIEVYANGDINITDCNAIKNTSDGILLNIAILEFLDRFRGGFGIPASGNVSVSGCTADMNLDDGIDVADAGGGNVVIMDCMAVGNFDDDGVDVDNAGDVTVENVTASMNGDEGLEINNVGGRSPSPAGKIAITRLTAELNGFATTSGDGIDIDSDCGNIATDPNDFEFGPFASKDISITDSLIRMNMSDGIEFEGLQPDGAYRVNGNIICQNMVAGLRSQGIPDGNCNPDDPMAPAVDATGNWWGDASGPTHPNNPGGIGDLIVDFNNDDDPNDFFSLPLGITSFAPFIQQAQIDASPNPVQVGNNVAITVKFSDTGKSVFLGLGVGDANGEPPFTVFTDLGTLIGSQGSGASIKEFINQPAGVLATTLAATAAGEADVLVSGPCGLDASAKINVNAAPPGPQQPEPGPQPQPPASQPTDGQSTNGQADCGVGMCGFGSLGMMPFMMLGLAVMKHRIGRPRRR